MEAVVKKLFLFRLLGACFFCVLLSGCQYGCSELAGDLSFACWNVQTFFDSVNDGCEYSDFRKSKYWNKNAYAERLVRLKDVMKELDCDVFVLEEIENEAVVVDIKNQLAGCYWDSRKCWNYTCFAKNENSAIGIAVFSRFPLRDLKVHNMDVRCEEFTQPDVRPIVQVTVKFGKRDVFLFANHWKSKSGDSEKSEIWRLWQENLLVGRILEAKKGSDEDFTAIICGDFNKDITEFQRCDDFDAAGNIILSGVQNEISCNEKIVVYSPWISSDGGFATEIGSYYYKNKWERIDHIFLYGAALISDFEPYARTPWASVEGIPVSYKIYSGQGYSDHLPLRCKVKL